MRNYQNSLMILVNLEISALFQLGFPDTVAKCTNYEKDIPLTF